MFHTNLSNIAEDIQRRLAKYGNLEKSNKIAKKSGALKKDLAQESRDLDYYDQNDSWVNDDEENAQVMELAEVVFEDFIVNNGSLKDFTQCLHY